MKPIKHTSALSKLLENFVKNWEDRIEKVVKNKKVLKGYSKGIRTPASNVIGKDKVKAVERDIYDRIKFLKDHPVSSLLFVTPTVISSAAARHEHNELEKLKNRNLLERLINTDFE